MHTCSQTKASGIKLSEVHGVDKGINPDIRPGRQVLKPHNSSDMELQRNVLKFHYGINYKYVGTLSHSFDRFYVVTKSELPKIQNLEFIIYSILCWM